MKYIFILLLAAMPVLLSSCGQPAAEAPAMLARLDSLQKRLDMAYRPGLGEFMSGIQVHHEKLWFAGKFGNWDLAGFEVAEIRESITDIQNYCQDRPEIQYLPMIHAPLDSLDKDISRKNSKQFTADFQLLTNTCNTCHQVSKHAFNVIAIPQTPPFSNQVFQPIGKQ